MKKSARFFIFLAAFLAALAVCFANAKKINADIFSLVNFENSTEQTALKSMLDSASNEFLLASNSPEFLEKSEILAEQSGVFEEYRAKQDVNLTSYLTQLNALKIALLNEQTYELLVKDKNEFFKQSAQNLFNQFAFKPLNAKDDFFALSSHMSLDGSKISLNLSNLMLEAAHEGEKFYLVKARLKPGYEPRNLIKFYEDVRELAAGDAVQVYASCGALYGAYGKAGGDKESAVMSAVSLSLCAIFLLLAFKNLRIFCVVFVAIFGFACGLAASLLIYESLSVMVVVIGTSLVGLMFDFALHWLGKNQNAPVAAASVRPMLKIFLLGLCITMSGYGVFAFSSLELLRQTAIFSLFTLLGAFLFTYFCLPFIFEGATFSQSAVFSRFFDKFARVCERAAGAINLKILLAAFALCAGILALNFKSLSAPEQIKDYANSPAQLLEQSKKISEITGAAPQNSVIVLKGDSDLIGDEKRLMRELKQANLVKDYASISKFILSRAEQESVKNIFKEAAKDEEIFKIYAQFGLHGELVKSELEKIANAQTIGVSEILEFDAAKNLTRFLPSKNISAVYADGLASGAKTDEILKANGAFSVDFVGALNQNLTEAKAWAAVLKGGAFLVAFALLWAFFGAARSLLVMSVIALGVLAVLCGFAALGVHVNIFAIFGLILASAVGIDYLIFALNEDLSRRERVFGIFAAFITSFISFFALSFSQTPAVSVFGLAVSLCVAFYGLAACTLAMKNLA
ncbi:MAG: hypothetical protein D8H92_06165 [Campylobacter sp.]|nr:MAG: hypothetical protein D8H92_06165 [Campylobacter sp.]